MATEDEILLVRRNTGEVGSDTYTHEYIGALIDATSVAGASARIWQEKAAAAADLVDTSEAGASRRLSQLHENYSKQAAFWSTAYAAEQAPNTGRAKVHVIDRE